MNKNLTHFPCRIGSLFLTALVLGHPVVAGGVRDIALTSIAAARNPITVDGSLAEWPDTHPATFAPLDPGLVTPATPAQAAAVARLHRQPVSASLQACYDSKALYLGIVWKGVPRDAGILTLHVQTDRIVHIRLIPAAGKQTIVQERIGDAADWHTLSSAAQCATVARPDRTATQEVCIPWQALTESGAPPAALTLAADLEWPQLTAAFLRQLPPGVRHDNTHLTDCFLTAPDKLFGRDAYLGNSNDWGTLHFVAGPHANATQVSAMSNGATETYVAHVAAPLPVTGSLAGWNPAQFQTAAYAPGLLGDRYSAKIAASYDADFLYIAAHVKALGGPLNTQPEATQAGYAGGDCLQVRLNDGQHTVNLCAWYDSTNKKPALTADGNDLKNPYLLKQGAKEAFIPDADGQGYTQEIAVPWSVLPGGGAPHDGDSWNGSFQVWWAGLNPQFTVLANASLASSGGIPYAYRLPAEADVTVGIFDAQGHLVRALVKDTHRRAGLNTEYWDGKDQYGQLAAPGRYVVKGISHPPIYAQPVISIGNPGTPPWPTADGTGDWLSDEMTPQGVATDGTTVYLAAPGSEKGSSIIAVAPDGKRIWAYNEAFSYPRSVTLAVKGQFLYALFSGPEFVHASDGSKKNVPVEQAFLICLDKTTGAPAQFSTQKPDLTIKTWPFAAHTDSLPDLRTNGDTWPMADPMGGLWDLRANKTFSPLTYGGQPRYATNDVGEPTDAVGIAATAAGRLYVSLLTQNQILVLDAATGKQMDTLSVSHPAGLYAAGDGSILAVSDATVVRINPDTKAVTTFVDHDLAAPAQVTSDAAGTVYVSDWGRSFQVKVFTPQGKFVRAIGTLGGRPWTGNWDANGMLVPHGVAVTNDGKLWVAEDDTSPSRISVWNATTGALIRDYIGPTAYGGGGAFWADPADISTMIGENTFFHVDYTKKTWTPVSAAFRRMSLNEPFTPGAMTGVSTQRVITHAGKQYYFVSVGGYSIVVFRRDSATLTPVAAMGDIFWPRSHDGTDLGIFDSNLGTHYIANYFPPFFKGHSNENFVWTDTNNDGQVQESEMEWVRPGATGPGNTYVPGTLPGLTAYWGYGVGPDGALYGYGSLGDKNVVGKVSIQKWLPSGVPVYSMANAQPVVVRPKSEGGEQSVCVDNNNHIILSRGYGYEGSARNGIDVYDQNNTFLWGIAETKVQQPDDILANNVIGEFKEPGGEDILASWLWHGNFKPYLFTSDGLYVSSLLEDTQLGPTATWDESYKNYFQGPDGTAYIVNGGKDTYHISRIVGLDSLRRFTGSIQVTEAALRSVQADAERLASTPPPLPQPTVHVAWLNTPPAIDGSLSDWNMTGSVTLTGTRNRSAHVALARDAANLYLAYDVQGAKFVNKGTDWRTLFISGDCDDLMLHVGQFKPHFAPAEGDERLLLSVYQGQPVAVLYRPVVPGTTSPAHLMATTIDQIVRLPNAKIAYKRSATGYTLEASVPLADIGIDPSARETLRGDVGVIYADETGSDRSLRLYYYNKHTSMTADLTTEATLQPAEWGDIEMPLGPNLIQNGDFEQPLAASTDQGWVMTESHNATTALIADEVSFTGSHSLLLKKTAPNVYTPENYNLPRAQKNTFFASGNGGTGGSRVAVRQRVPVTPGKKYSIRFHYRTVGFPKASDDPGENRGYASFQMYLAWNGPQGGNLMLNCLGTRPEWQTIYNDRFNFYGVKTPFTAAPGVNSVDIIIALEDNATKVLPEVYVDDMEMVEVP